MKKCTYAIITMKKCSVISSCRQAEQPSVDELDFGSNTVPRDSIVHPELDDRSRLTVVLAALLSKLLAIRFCRQKGQKTAGDLCISIIGGVTLTFRRKFRISGRYYLCTQARECIDVTCFRPLESSQSEQFRIMQLGAHPS